MLREICRRSLSSPKKIVAADWKEGSDGRLSPPDGADGERLSGASPPAFAVDGREVGW